jgi:hypothetical protein
MLELANGILLDSTMKFPIGWIVTSISGVPVELSSTKLYEYVLQCLGHNADYMSIYKILFNCRKLFGSVCILTFFTNVVFMVFIVKAW